jgi:hypothetical protein
MNMLSAVVMHTNECLCVHVHVPKRVPIYVCIIMYKYMYLLVCRSVLCIFCRVFFQVLAIVDAKPKALRLPTDAYYAVEEVHDVSIYNYYACTFSF